MKNFEMDGKKIKLQIVNLFGSYLLPTNFKYILFAFIVFKIGEFDFNISFNLYLL